MTNLTHNSFFFPLYVYFNSLPVSSKPRANRQENQLYQYIIWYVTLCRWPSNTHWYNWFSWWWARGCSKHAQNWNKHTEKGIVRQVGHLHEPTLYVPPSMWETDYSENSTYRPNIQMIRSKTVTWRPVRIHWAPCPLRIQTATGSNMQPDIDYSDTAFVVFLTTSW
jgi:hypothetical protein